MQDLNDIYGYRRDLPFGLFYFYSKDVRTIYVVGVGEMFGGDR